MALRCAVPVHGCEPGQCFLRAHKALTRKPRRACSGTALGSFGRELELRAAMQVAALTAPPTPQLRADQADGNERDGHNDADHERANGKGCKGRKQRKAAQGNEKAGQPALGSPRVCAALFTGQCDLDLLFHSRSIMAPLR